LPASAPAWWYYDRYNIRFLTNLPQESAGQG
jgi:hypothetical protein